MYISNVNKKIISLLFSLFILVGCGNDNKNTTINFEEKIGYIIDSPVVNLSYSCGDINDLTNKDGQFICLELPIVFSIGNIEIGVLNTITSDSKIYPQDLLGISRDIFENNKDLIKLLILLQSLDNDGNISNEIILPTDIPTDTKQKLNDMTLNEVKSFIQNLGKTPVSEADALTHLRETFGLDTIKPIITLNGANPLELTQGSTYTELGATATDDIDGTVDVTISGTVDISKIGTYLISYIAIDKARNDSNISRTVKVNAQTNTGGGTTNPTELIITSKIKLLSPIAKSTIDYNYVTLEIQDNVSDVKVNVGTREYVGVKNGSSFFVYDVLLANGTNEINLTADNGAEKLTVTIDSADKGIPPIIFDLDKIEGYGSLIINAKVETNGLQISKYLIDTDGDSITDSNSSSANFTLNYPNIGAYNPRVVVRTTNNVLYSIVSRDAVNILENPIEKAEILIGVSGIQDLEEYGAFVYALTGSSVIKISENNALDRETIKLAGLSGAKGFTFDSKGNIFVADTGNNRVVKFLASTNYQVDSTFDINTTGSSVGTLNSPVDITTSNIGEELSIFVLDRGNNAIQLFDYAGNYVADFDGSTTSEGKLNSPLNMVGSSRLIITDVGNGILRELNYNSITKTESGSSLLSLNNFGKVTYSSDGLLLSDNANNKFLFVDITGNIEKELPTNSSNLIGMAYEQNHQLLKVSNGSSSIEHIIIPKTAPQASPKALAEKFVKAYLEGDDITMLSLTSRNNIDKLKKIDTKVQEAFKNMFSYNEQIYMHGLKAVSVGKTNVSVGEVSIKFYFNWGNNQWYLSEIT